MRIKVLPLIFVLLLAITVQIGLARAQEKASNSEWRVTLAPYAWLTGFYGTMGAHGTQVHVANSFSNLAKYLNFATMIHADILYHDTVGLLGELNYSQLGDQVSGKAASLDGQMRLLLSDIAAFYRVGTISLGKNGDCPTTLDLLAGARIWSIGMNLKFNSSELHRSIYRGRSWVDPIVGARLTLKMTDQWALALRGGVGGFGISSAITWDAMALLGYTFWKHGTAFAGYRAVGVNHSEGSGTDSFKYDATLSGPILGVAFTF